MSQLPDLNNKNENPLGGRTLIIAAAFFGVMYLWNIYLQNKYPDYNKPPVKTETVTQKEKEKPSKEIALKEKELVEKSHTESVQKEEEKFLIDGPNNTIGLSSKGMSFIDWTLNNYTHRDKTIINLFEDENRGFELLVDETPIYMTIEVVNQNKYIASWSNQNLSIERIYELDDLNYKVESRTIITRKNQTPFPKISFNVNQKVNEVEGGSLFVPSYETQDLYVEYDGTTDRLYLEKGELPDPAQFNNVKYFSFSNHYFTTAILGESDLVPSLKLEKMENGLNGKLEYLLSGSKKESFEITHTMYMGPKSFDIMATIDESFVNTINFGMFSVLAKPLLQLMKFLQKYVVNWGLAIILLTIIVRLIVLPFNIRAQNSMKAMQKIQPQMKTLREKYKEDPQKLQIEMMGLMKKHKVNPLGGCLPMFLQFPVFLALYQVLGQSIELYQAPLIWWIQDLSVKDPFYVLPILMGLSMFIHMQIMPNNMDPNQQKIMKFMPVVFTLLMVGMPSGLALYIFTSTVFAIFQHVFFFSENKWAIFKVNQKLHI